MATIRDLSEDRGVYVSCVLKRRIKLHPRLQNKHYMESITNILRTNVEGVCGSDGYVRPHSVQILHVSSGLVEMSSLSGTVTYGVRFMADVCNPAVGDVLTCRVENVNTFGVLAVNMSETRVLEAILPREPLSFQHVGTLDNLEPGDTLRLEVMARSFKLGQRTITLVGRVVAAGEKGAHMSDQDNELRDESEDDDSAEPSESDDLEEVEHESVDPEDPDVEEIEEVEDVEDAEEAEEVEEVPELGDADDDLEEELTDEADEEEEEDDDDSEVEVEV